MDNPLIRAARISEFFRFLFVGVLNTGATVLLFDLLRRSVSYLVAYTLTYVVGVGISCLLSAKFVFKVKVTARAVVLFPFVYVAQYLFGIFLMWALVGRLELHPTAALVVVAGATVPLTFILSRLLMRRIAASV